MRNNNTHKQGAAGGNRKYGTCSVLCWLLGAPMFQTALCALAPAGAGRRASFSQNLLLKIAHFF